MCVQSTPVVNRSYCCSAVRVLWISVRTRRKTKKRNIQENNKKKNCEKIQVKVSHFGSSFLAVFNSFLKKERVGEKKQKRSEKKYVKTTPYKLTFQLICNIGIY